MFCKLTFELTGQIVTELYSLLCTVFMSILCTRLAIPSDVFVDLGKNIRRPYWSKETTKF